MTLKIKRIRKTEAIDDLPIPLPIFLTDEFQIWYYAILDEHTVLVVSTDSCQVQTFDETFNGKYSVTFDELQPCTAEEFQEIYLQIRLRIYQADHAYQTMLQPAGLPMSAFSVEKNGHLKAAS